MEGTMFDADRRPMGRLFYWLLAVVMIAGCGLTTTGAAPVPQNGLASTTVADTIYLADGSTAQGSLIITWPAFVTSTTVGVDAGISPGNGYAIEVRTHDYGFGTANGRNLLGRFSTRTFTLPRLGRTQNYCLRLYDNSTPPRYSRYSAALHVDYPL